MKQQFLSLTISGLSALAVAQGDIPDCATSCIADAVAQKTTCEPTDLNCKCTTINFDLIQAGAGTCVITSCGQDQALTVLQAVKSACDSLLQASFSSATSSAAATKALDSSTPTAIGTPTATIADCSCSDESVTPYPTAAPSSTIGVNGTATASSSTSRVTSDATVAMRVGGGLLWLVFLAIMTGI